MTWEILTAVLACMGLSGSLFADCDKDCCTKSAATQRFTVDDSRNEFYTLFRYTPVKGLGYEKGVGRRDPSNIIKVGDYYYVWYTRIAGQMPTQNWRTATETQRAYMWDLADIWYAKSKDGYEWEEQGKAVGRGPKGSWDDRRDAAEGSVR